MTGKLFYKAIKKIIVLPCEKTTRLKGELFISAREPYYCTERVGMSDIAATSQTATEKNKINWLPAFLKAPIFRIMTKLSVFT